MSEYSMLEATIETYIDIEDLGITDFDNLTDEQVLGLFDAYEELHRNTGGDEMVIQVPTFDQYDLDKYQDKYDELFKERMKDFENHTKVWKRKDEELDAEQENELRGLEEKYDAKHMELRRENRKEYDGLCEKWYDDTPSQIPAGIPVY